jgi:hypothetical protein
MLSWLDYLTDERPHLPRRRSTLSRLQNLANDIIDAIDDEVSVPTYDYDYRKHREEERKMRLAEEMIEVQRDKVHEIKKLRKRVADLEEQLKDLENDDEEEETISAKDLKKILKELKRKMK